jgi:hypothetical protein
VTTAERKLPEDLAADLYDRLRDVLLEERRVAQAQGPDCRADYVLTAIATLLIDVAQAGGCRMSVLVGNVAEMAGLKVERFAPPHDGKDKEVPSC